METVLNSIDKAAFGRAAAFLAVALSCTACASVLPKSTTTTRSPWSDFDEAKVAFDRITPLTTTVEDLKTIGYDPYSNANVQVLSYVDVVQRFIPRETIRLEDLDEGLRDCIAATRECWAYEIAPGNVRTEREGNVALDVFGFKRTTVTTGWAFKAVVVLKGDIVQYKVWSGTRKIEERRNVVKPLGPLQEIDNVVKVPQVEVD